MDEMKRINEAAEKVIAALEPYPGRAFQPAEPTVYSRPDVFVVELDGELQIVLILILVVLMHGIIMMILGGLMQLQYIKRST